MKKLFLFFTVAMFIFSSLAYAGGGRGNGGRRTGFTGSIAGGTSHQIRIQKRSSSRNGYAGTLGSRSLYKNRNQSRKSAEKNSAGSNVSGDATRTQDRKTDGSCE